MNEKMGSTNKSPVTNAESSGNYSLVNIVFNYFTDSQEDKSGPVGEKIAKLEAKAEKLKANQTAHMKFMNQMFASLVNNNKKVS